MTSPYAAAAIALFLFVNAWFAVALALKRNDVADIAWGLGFVLVAWTGFAFSEQSARSLLVNALVTAWGLRLAWHIARRNLRKPEDARYAAWRQEWTWFRLRSYLLIFLLQGVLLYAIALPILFIHASRASALTIVDAAGAAVWLAGFFLRGRRRRATETLPARPREQREDHGSRALGVLAPSELLRRSDAVVGRLPPRTIAALRTRHDRGTAHDHRAHTVRVGAFPCWRKNTPAGRTSKHTRNARACSCRSHRDDDGVAPVLEARETMQRATNALTIDPRFAPELSLVDDYQIRR
jgi:hypothetical protein